MRTSSDIIKDIFERLEQSNLIYELKSLKNVVASNFNSTEIIGETGSVLLKMNEKLEVKRIIGELIEEFVKYSESAGIHPTPSKFYSLNQKAFTINGADFYDLKGFYNSIGEQLVDKNEWGKNWNALNDILIGGFIKTEYGEPFRLIWKNSEISRVRLEDFEDIVRLIREHDHINLELK